MIAPSSQDVTRLLIEWGQGNESALNELIPLVYAELQVIAHRYLGREQAGHTMQTSALVHEAYLRLVNESELHFEGRAHFFGIAARLMRQILVDHARSRDATKRGGQAQRVSFEELLAIEEERSTELLALDEALTHLAQVDERKCRVAELRFFAGLSVEETAQVLQVAPITVMREWRLAKAWLRRELTRENIAES